MIIKTYYKCMRCGYEYQRDIDTEAPKKERYCPKCDSNSVRIIKEEKK